MSRSIESTAVEEVPTGGGSSGSWSDSRRICRRRPWPRIEDYLAEAGPDRGVLLVELVHADLELELGEPGRVEELL